MPSQTDQLETFRRELLAVLGGATLTGMAGCLGGNGNGNGNGGNDQGVDPVQDRVTVDPADIEEGGTFRTAIGANIDTFDYPYSSSASSTVVHNLLYEGMITTSATGRIYPWLAESYDRKDVQETSATDYEPYMVTAEYNSDGVPQTDGQIVVAHPDNDPSSGQGKFLTVNEAPDAIDDGTYGMHYQFNLHEGITFHNGEELTAQNVVQSYERVQGSALSGQVYDSLLDIQAPDDYTIELYAQEPDAAAIRELGGLPVYPEETATLPPEKMDPRQGNTPLGTGPFQFEEFQNQQYVRVSKFDNYWFETGMKDWFEGSSDFPNGPVVDAVDIAIIPDPASRSAALQNNERDMVYGLNSSDLTDYQQADGYRTAATDGAGFTFLQFPVRDDPWTSKKLRQAVNHLIPREDIASNIFNGWVNPAWVPLPPVAARNGTTGYDQLVEDLRHYNEYDPDRADELAQQAIDENNIETPIQTTFLTNSDNDDRVRTLQLIVESLNQKDYFDVSVDTKEFLTLVQQILSPDFYQEGKMVMIGLSGGFNPHGYAKAIHSPDNFAQCCNFQNIDIDRLNSALEDARYGVDVVEDPDLRRQRYDDVWEIILEENANSYSHHDTVVGVTNNEHVHGFNTYPSVQNIVGYALYSPQDEQVAYLTGNN
ncbi:MAG: ABC transporter substrate-binding protein [Haloarculaceae archaeon]